MRDEWNMVFYPVSKWALIRAALLQSSPGMQWCDTSRRGYLTLSFNAAETRCDWVFMKTIRERTAALIAIAHPDHRDHLTREAHALGHL